MAKRKSQSLTSYFIRALLGFFIAILSILLLSTISLLLLINNGIIFSVDAGEKISAEVVEELTAKGRFDSSIIPDICDYSYYDDKGILLESSIRNEKVELTLKRANKEKVSFKDGSYCYVSWTYDNQFVNRQLRNLFPNIGTLWIISTFVCLCGVFFFFIKRISRNFRIRLSIIDEICQKVENRELDFAVPIEVGISEFDNTTRAMISMRDALKDSLYSQWQSENQKKEELLSLTHDLRTPLTIIKANSQLFAEEDLNEEQKEQITLILTNANRIQVYLKSLSDILADRMALEHNCEFSLEVIVKMVLKNMNALLLRKNLTVCLVTSTELKMSGDEIALERMVSNILDNAIRVSKIGGKIWINIYEECNNLILEIKDQGGGFSLDALQHASEFLWQEDKSRSSDSNHGLGLAIVKKIAGQHSGSLSFSNWKEGARVKIVFVL